MSSKKMSLRRLIAGVGAFVLGSLAMGTAASAAGYEPPEGNGTLIIHKHVDAEGSVVGDPAGTEGDPAGDPLKGVEFTVTEVGWSTEAGCRPMDHGSPADWKLINAMVEAGAPSDGSCPLGDPITVETDEYGIAPAIPGLNGLYWVTETDPGENLIVAPAAPFLLTVPMPDGEGGWVYTVHAYPKNDLTTFVPGKTVAIANEDYDVLPGAEIPWTITVPVPVAAFPYYEITIKDIPSAGHTFKEYTSVRLGTVDLGYTGDGAEISLNAAGLAAVNAVVTGAGATPATITLELLTVVGENPVGLLSNTAEATLNGNTKTTPGPVSIWGKLVVEKYAEGTEVAARAIGTPLAGAEFAVYEGTCSATDVSVDTPVVTGTTGTDGTWEQSLWIGNRNADDTSVLSKAYCLVETKAPDGYILDSTPIDFVLSSDATDYTTTVQFPNVPVDVPQIPLTGAQGTMLMTLSGLALVGIAGGGYLVHRSRRTV